MYSASELTNRLITCQGTRQKQYNTQPDATVMVIKARNSTDLYASNAGLS